MTHVKDTLAARVELLAREEVVALAPLLTLVADLGEDASRQYDSTAAEVLAVTCERLLSCLESAVDTDRWVNVRQAAAIARRPEPTVRHWCRTQKVLARKVGHRDWEIERSSILKRAAA